MFLLLEVTAQPNYAMLITAVASVVAALGLKELWPLFFQKEKSICEKNIVKLSSHIVVILTIIRAKFDDAPAVQNAMDDLHRIVEEINQKQTK